jgi:hypothetical protein
MLIVDGEGGMVTLGPDEPATVRPVDAYASP